MSSKRMLTGMNGQKPAQQKKPQEVPKQQPDAAYIVKKALEQPEDQQKVQKK